MIKQQVSVSHLQLFSR